MKTNKQWLDELAATDPNSLQAWFDAPRADYEQVDGSDVDSSTSCETCDYKRANERQARKIENVCALNDELTRKLDNLAQDIAESERLREEMREELSIAYDHAHDLLARRDRWLE